jgi:DNA-binding GntR family transcriptional regulator
VYEQLKQALLYAEFRPGQVLSIRTLAAMMGTSTMPVREAITRLVTERALEALPNRGVRVPELSLQQIRDQHRVRRALEPLAAELAAPQITDDKIAELDRYERDIEAALKAGQLTLAVRANIAFHLTLYRAARSDTLLELIEALYLRYAPMLYRVLEALPGGVLGQTVFVRDHHSAVMDALRARDPRGARRALERDLDASLELKAFEPRTGARERARSRVRRSAA